jgi:hypothetical protein
VPIAGGRLVPLRYQRLGVAQQHAVQQAAAIENDQKADEPESD